MSLVQSHSHWQRLKHGVQSTELYQVFVVRAPRRNPGKTKLAYWGCFGFWFGAFIFGIELINPVLDLKQMQKIDAVLVEVKARESSRSEGDHVFVKTADSKVIELRKHLSSEEMSAFEAVVGKPITVWTQDWITWLGTKKIINQARYENKLIVDYSQIHPRRTMWRPIEVWMTIIFFILPFIQLFVIWREDKKHNQTPELSVNSKEGGHE